MRERERAVWLKVKIKCRVSELHVNHSVYVYKGGSVYLHFSEHPTPQKRFLSSDTLPLFSVFSPKPPRCAVC